MNLDQIATKCFILALFIRDDGERLLLGDGYYDFNQKLQHFQANTIANDVVEIQGDSGQLLAGQVMRSGAQKFEGYIGDATTNRQIIEQKRSDFMAFFRIKHFYKVIYIFPDGTAIQRQRGYLTDAPTIPEIFQKFPEYSVALNFEDANYYEYAEDEHGDEIYAHIAELALAGGATGGLIWDAIGAVTNGITWSGIQTAQGEYIQITNELDIPAKLSSVEMLGNAEQTTLPSDYQAVEYIEANATQYIDTGVQLGANDFTIETGVTPTADASYEQPFLSIWTSAYGYWNWFKTGQNLDCYTSGHHLINGGATTGTYYDLKLSRVGDTWSQSSNSTSGSWTFSPSSVNNTTLKVFNRGDLNGKTNAQLYYLRIFVAGELVRNYVPCYRRSDSAIGLYDLVKGTFSASAGTDNFTKGTDTSSPSPSCPQDIEVVTGENVVKIVGKNLFDVSKITNVADHLWNNGDGTISITTYAGNTFVACNETFAQLCPSLKVGDVVTLSAESTGTGKLVYFLGSGGSWSFGATKTITEAMLTSKLSFYASGVNTSATISNIMFELGSTATAYEPYQGQEFEVNLGSIELCKIGDYQDRIYKEDGKWYIEKQVGKVVLDGTQTILLTNWRASSTSVGWVYAYNVFNNATIPAGNIGAIMSDNFVASSFASLFDKAQDSGIALYTNTDYGVTIRTPDTSLTTTNAINTWLASNPTTVYYALATPTTTEITNEALIAQLDALGASSLYLGLNNIGTETQNAMPTLKVEYYTEVDLDGAGYEWEPGGNTARTIVTVAGVDSAWPIWTIQGGAQNPTLTNITTGQTISWQGFVPEGQTLTINMAEMTADLAGANVFEYITGEWIRLAPGNNTLVYSAGSADKPSTLSWNGVLA